MLGKPVGKTVIEVMITASGKVGFYALPGCVEQMENQNILALVGDAMATFGEQLKMQGLNVTKRKPSGLYGPRGEEV